MIRSKKITQSARGEECQLQWPGICNGNPETVVWCHLPDGNKGMGIKASDISGFYGCSSCHDFVDGRRRDRYDLSDDDLVELERALYRAHIRSLHILADKEIIAVKS